MEYSRDGGIVEFLHVYRRKTIRGFSHVYVELFP